MKWEKASLEGETYESVKKNVRELLIHLFKQKKAATEHDRVKIAELLGQIPHIVINFDETITVENGVSRMLESAKKHSPLSESEFAEKITEFKDTKEKVQTFYGQLASGIDYEVMSGEFKRIAGTLTLNPNFIEAVEILKKTYNIKKVPLFVASLNNLVMLEGFYMRKDISSIFDKVGVDIVGVIGNQIEVDDQGNISGIIEHVKDDTKHELVPKNGIVLVDHRETEKFLDKDFNAINIQFEHFDSELFHLSMIANRFHSEFGDLQLVRDFLKNLHTAKLSWESEIESLIQQKKKIERSQNIDKMVKDLYSLYKDIINSVYGGDNGTT